LFNVTISVNFMLVKLIVLMNLISETYFKWSGNKS
jgi:hypothetical protein